MWDRHVDLPPTYAIQDPELAELVRQDAEERKEDDG
jgi:hypothetical protein